MSCAGHKLVVCPLPCRSSTLVEAASSPSWNQAALTCQKLPPVSLWLSNRNKGTAAVTSLPYVHACCGHCITANQAHQSEYRHWAVSCSWATLGDLGSPDPPRWGETVLLHLSREPNWYLKYLWQNNFPLYLSEAQISLVDRCGFVCAPGTRRLHTSSFMFCLRGTRN